MAVAKLVSSRTPQCDGATTATNRTCSCELPRATNLIFDALEHGRDLRDDELHMMLIFDFMDALLCMSH